MVEVNVRNVNHALPEGMWLLKTSGVRETSRNGDVIVMPEPVMTTYQRPQERVLFHPLRDANPVFHLMEAIWMLAGGYEVGWLLPYNSNFGRYAEDDGHVHGAYGRRWREHFGFDQVKEVVRELKKNPDSRRAVIAMWDPLVDLGANKRDVPCNTTIYFDLRGGRLNMTVCCRSNDAIWGAYGANVVHMSVLQEVIAAGLNVPMGVYRQFSNNFHIYPDVDVARKIFDYPGECEHDLYSASAVVAYPLLPPECSLDAFLDDCKRFVLGIPVESYFLQNIARPLQEAYLSRKAGESIDLSDVPDNCDWKLAFLQWCERRAK